MQHVDQPSLLSFGLSSLQLDQRVRVIAEGWDGVVAQVWPGRDWFAVFAWRMPGHSIYAPLPVYRRDELEALPLVEDEAAARARLCHSAQWRGESGL